MLLPGWQGIFATEEAVRGRGGDNTGGLTKFIPALDIDILDETAAQIVEDVARSYLQGQILVRMGQVPKRAILLRTDAPFRKIVASSSPRTAARTRSKCLATASNLSSGATILIRACPMRGRTASLRPTRRETSCRWQTTLRQSSICALPS